MTRAEAIRILKTQRVYCARFQGSRKRICTGGTQTHPRALVDLAWKTFLDCEPATPSAAPSVNAADWQPVGAGAEEMTHKKELLT